MFEGKSFLITGGTGSFGKKCAEALLRLGVRRLVIYSRDELKQSEMAQRMSSSAMRYFIGDVRDLPRLTMAMSGVDYVIHAAALKQVPAAEYNPMEFIKTNIMGAENVIDASLAAGVKKVIALSTDKAACPINLYGATKLVSDKLFISANNLAGERCTRFSVVRYGNVLGSRGSVLPYFRRLLKDKATEFPITHADMTRFSITLEHGVNFVFKSLELMRGGEVFVPKIPSLRIAELASALGPDLPQKIVGLRPGEKLHEVLCPADESRQVLEFPSYYLIQPAIRFNMSNDYSENPAGQIGKPVPEGFEYNSGTNGEWLVGKELLKMIESTDNEA